MLGNKSTKFNVGAVRSQKENPRHDHFIIRTVSLYHVLATNAIVCNWVVLITLSLSATRPAYPVLTKT